MPCLQVSQKRSLATKNCYVKRFLMCRENPPVQQTINLNLLRSLKVLLEECHVSHAAQRLNLTQSAVSRHLSTLREMFADPLLVRDGNLLIPTPKALLLQKKLESWFVELDDMMSNEVFEPSLWHGEFVLSSSDYVAQYILPEIIRELMQEAPHVTLTYRLWQPDLIHQLHNEGIHLASSMSLEAPKGLSSIQIGEDHSVCLMGAHHPLASSETISVQELLHYPHIKIVGGGDKDGLFETALNALGQQRHIALHVPFFFAAAQALCQNDLLLVTPEHIAHHLSERYELTYRALPFTTPKHKYWLTWHSKYDLDPSHIWARSMIEAIMKRVKGSVAYEFESYPS